MSDVPPPTPHNPLMKPSRTREREHRNRVVLAEQLDASLVAHRVDPRQEMVFWERMARIVAPRPWMAELRANFFLFVLVLIVSYGGWCVWDRFVNELPSTVSSVAVTNGPVALGTKAEVTIDLVRHRVCERDFEWIVQDARGKRERFREPHMHAIGDVGPDHFIQSFQIPGDLTPGRAHLRLVWSWMCPENLYEQIYPVTLVMRDLPFDIVARPGTPATVEDRRDAAPE